MKKLNNKGWSMFTFLILIGLLFCTLLLVAYLINELDEDLPSSSKSNNSSYYIDMKA